MSTGQLSRSLPLRRELSGPRQAIPILRTSGDAALHRIGGINWTNLELFLGNQNGLIGSFSGRMPKADISDFEYLVEIGTALLRDGEDARGIVINLTGDMSALCGMHGSRILAGPPCRLKLTFRR